MDGLKFNASLPEYEVLLKSLVQKSLPPNVYLPEDTINNTISVFASAAYNTANYIKSDIASGVSPFLASGRNLEYIAGKVGLTGRLVSTRAKAGLIFTRDNNFAEAVLPKGTEIDIDGTVFTIDNDLGIGENKASAFSVEYGALGIQPAYATFLNPVRSFEEVIDIDYFSDGRNSENDEEFRARIIDYFKNPSFFPNEAGFQEIIISEFPSVRNIKAEEIDGTIYIYPICARELFPPYGIPDADTLGAVAEYLKSLNTFGIQTIEVKAPEYEGINIKIYSIRPDTVVIRKQITEYINQYFYSIQQPGIDFNPTDLINMLSAVVGLVSYNSFNPNYVINPSSNKKFFVLGSIEFLEGQI